MVSRGAGTVIGVAVATGILGAGYVAYRVLSQSAPGGGGGGGGGSGSACAEDSDCQPCFVCEDGACLQYPPAQIVQTTDLTNLSQDETVGSVGVPLTNLAVCDWGSLEFQGGQNVFTGTGQILDANGKGVPCIVPTVRSTNGSVQVVDGPGETDQEGNFSFTFRLASPDEAGSGCPGPGDTAVGELSGSINVAVPGLAVTPFPFIIKTYVTGV